MDPDDHGIRYNHDYSIATRTLGAHSLINFDDQLANLIYYAKLKRYTNFVPHLNGRYLSSNANITIFNSDGEAVSVPVGSE